MFVVIGAAGAQGMAVLRALKRRAMPSRAFVRSGNDAARARAAGAEETAIGDLNDAESLAAAVRSASAVFLVTPFEADAAAARQTAERVVTGLTRGGARHVVFNTGILSAMPAVGVGSVDGKLETLMAMRDGGIPHVALGVTFYLENWLMPWASRRLQSDDVLSYPLPADMPVSWLAHADMAEAAVTALPRPALAGRTMQLGGPSRTPQMISESVGRLLGRVVRFEMLPLRAFIEGGDAASGPARVGTAIGALYEWATEQSGTPTDVGTAGLEELDVRPTEPRSWLASQDWR